MIASVFEKSTPVNFLLLLFLTLISIIIYQSTKVVWVLDTMFILEKISGVVLLLISIVLVDIKEAINRINNKSEYTTLIIFFLLLLFPTVSINFNIIAANFLILIAFHNILSLQKSNLKTVEKIFDSSLFILVASFFHFWCILYLLLVFIAILRHDRTSFRKWMLPFMAIFVVFVLFLLYCLFFKLNFIDIINKKAAISFELNYYTNYLQNMSFAIYSSIVIFFLLTLSVTMKNHAKDLMISIRKTLFAFCIGAVIFIISANKSNDLLLFTFVPLSMIATFELKQDASKTKKEVILYSFLIFCLTLFFLQLQ